MREVVLLGSTGSIGTQAIDVIKRNPDRFRVAGIAAGGGNVELLARQALDLRPEVVAVARPTAVEDLQLAFYAEAQKQGYSSGEFKLPKILAGKDAAAELATHPADITLNGIDGSRGLPVTLAALEAGRTVALANKESLVAGGPLVRKKSKPGQLVPVDSEHSALAQCLRAAHPEDGDPYKEVRKLYITASGGPFRGRTRQQMLDVTPAEALKHPNWSMGPLNTINSATLVNKGLEAIEAHELFFLPYEKIDVIVQPKSIVHALVEFADGSTVLQASPPDMRLAIALALAWPGRVPEAGKACDWSQPVSWEFEPVDHEAFPGVRLAFEAGRAGGTAPAVYNAANETCVSAFVDGRLPFVGIVDTVGSVLAEHTPSNVETFEDVIQAEEWARARANELVNALEDRS